MLTPAKIDSYQEESASGSEEDKTNVVKLAHELPLGLSILSVLCLKCRWLVEEEEKDSCTCMEGAHIPIRTSPANLGMSNEGISNEGAEER